MRAQSAAAQGQFNETVARGRELVVMSRNDHFGGSGVSAEHALGNLRTALIMLGHLDDALMVAREASQLFAQSGTLWSALDPFALLAFKRGHTRHAALALGRAEATMQAWRGGLREPNEQRARDEAVAGLRQTLAADELQRLLAEGAQLSDEDAAWLALAD